VLVPSVAILIRLRENPEVRYERSFLATLGT